MEKLVNIIHPVVYKLKGGNFILGRIDEYKERNEKLTHFLRTALENNATVIHQRDEHPDSIGGAMRDAYFYFDDENHILFDERIKVAVTTMRGGPIPKEKPEKMPEDKWRIFQEVYTSHSQLQAMIRNPDITFFIGGVLERCLGNAAGYQQFYYKKEGQRIVYIPELCVSLDTTEREEMESKLTEREIHSISYEEALKILEE